MWLTELLARRRTFRQRLEQISGTSRLPYVVGMISLTLAVVEVVSWFIGGGTGSDIRFAAGISFLIIAAAYLPWVLRRWNTVRSSR
jgi:hypothetical protein